MSSPGDLRQFATLVAIFTRLRAEDGCPWDRKQTHHSLRENLLEECHEVLETLDRQDPAKLREELGDLLMQIVFHAQISQEKGEFDINDVIAGINAKLIHRHPHIFGTAEARTAEEVAHNWEALKKAERPGSSMLEGVPWQMPALAYAQSVQRRAAQVGFDWNAVDDIVEKLGEEVKEYQEAARPEEKAAEFGDLLFTLVNLARRMGIDAESALRETNRKFYRRFSTMEEICRRRGLDLSKLSLEEMDTPWEEAKRELND